MAICCTKASVWSTMYFGGFFKLPTDVHLFLSKAPHNPASVVNACSNIPHDLKDDRKVGRDFVIARARQQGNCPFTGFRPQAVDEIFVQVCSSDFVKEGMSNPCAGNPTSLVPLIFKWQCADDVVDVTSHFSDPPWGPCPELWWQIIVNRDPSPSRGSGDPPVEAREIHEHNSIRWRLV